MGNIALTAIGIGATLIGIVFAIGCFTATNVDASRDAAKVALLAAILAVLCFR